MFLYYIHTEKYSPKSYVVNFRTQISSSQSEERKMVFTREKNDTSNQNRERCFFTCEKNDTSNQKPQRCVSFSLKFPPFIAACSAASHTFTEKSFGSISAVSRVRSLILPEEEVLYGIYALTVFVSEILLVRCAHSFDF